MSFPWSLSLKAAAGRRPGWIFDAMDFLIVGLDCRRRALASGSSTRRRVMDQCGQPGWPAGGCDRIRPAVRPTRGHLAIADCSIPGALERARYVIAVW